MTDTPKTIAEMREALRECAEALDECSAQFEHSALDGCPADVRAKRAALRARVAVRTHPADDAEMEGKVAKAICEAPPRTVETADGTTVELAGCLDPGACKLCSYGARAALSAMRGEQ